MGQIVIRNQVPVYCNLAAIQSGGTKANDVLGNGEIWLVDTTNANKTNGTGVYDAYIKGNGSSAAKNLTVQYLTAQVDLSAYSTTQQMTAAIQNAVSGKQDTISTVTVNIENNEGTVPSGTASLIGNSLAFTFNNIKGVKGDAGATGATGATGLQGPAGPKGDSGVQGDVSSLTVVHSIDIDSSYGNLDVAGADALQTLNTTVIKGEQTNNPLIFNKDDSFNIKSTYLTIDDIAYENLSFRDIFETNNGLGISAGFENGGFKPLVVGNGSLDVTNQDYDTPFTSLKCFGNTSNYIQTSGNTIQSVFLFARVKCVRYVSGNLGVSTGNVKACVNGVTNGWVTVSAEKDTSTKNGGFVGSWESANLDGYVDSPIFVNRTIFTVVPSLETLTTLYNIYIDLKKNNVTDIAVPKKSIGADRNNLVISIDNNVPTLKEIVYENFTLSDIFENNNTFGISAGFKNGSYSPMVVGAGSPQLVNDAYIGGYSLYCSGSSSQQIKTNTNFLGTYYMAAVVKCTRYNAGNLGVTFGTYNNASVANTCDWTIVSAIEQHTSTSYMLYIGSFSSADLDGYVDMPVAVNMDIFTVKPSVEQLNILYNQWLLLKSGNITEVKYKLKYISDTYSDGDCIQAFVDKMNDKAKLFGMSNTHFINPSGMHDENHYSCAKDIAKLCYICTSSNKLVEYWGQEAYNISVINSSGVTRQLQGVSSYKGDSMTSVGNYYHIFGGKSGTWTLNNVSNKNLTLAVKSKVDDKILVGCIIKSSVDDRGIPFKQLLDWLEEYRVNSAVSTPTLSCSYASAFVAPNYNPILYQDVNLEMVGKNSTTHYLPASMTKLMTAYIAMEYLTLDEILTYKSTDIKSGSGDTFYDGDKIKASDAILEMLLPSSNTTATMIARIVGKLILENKYKK